MPNNFVGPHPDQPKTPRLPVLRPLFFRPIAVLALWIAAASTVWAGQAIPSLALQPGLDDILQYIASGWETLTRSMNECKSVVDPKAAGPSILYLPAGFAKPVTVAQMQRNCRVEARPLPVRITHLGQAKVEQIKPSGLLYLPHPYVVPGGRFNEMYGWDSYFILRGLLAASKLDLARGTVENFFFEIENYGWVLNANRSYYLTRSQPPFLSSMVMAIYDAEKDAGRDDREWLARAYPYVARDYQLWVNPPHLADGTGLSRYFDFGDGPVPESFGEGYYRHVAAYFLNHPELAKGEIAGVDGTSASDLSGPVLSLILCQSPEAMRARRPSAAEFGGTGCDTVRRMSLTKDYYKGDRSMRESGFDMSFRFSPFGGRTHHYAAVGLNSLLFKVETDLERMAATLGRPREAHDWHDRAEARRTGGESLSLGPGPWALLRLRFRQASAFRVRFCNHVLPTLGRLGIARTGGRGPKESEASRTARGPRYQHGKYWWPMGLPLWMGAAPTNRCRGSQALRIQSRCRSTFNRVSIDGSTELPSRRNHP